MSFEGYEQFLCKNGHYWTSDVYDRDNECPRCGELADWSHMVDTTNDDGEPMKLTIKEYEIYKCRCCRGTGVEKIPIFRVPRSKKAKKNEILQGS